MIRIFPRYKKTKNILFLLTGFITFGLFYDALMLALGGVMEGGGLLLTLSRLRFVSHGALIPLIFLICAYALNLKGIPLKAVWVLTGVLMFAFSALGPATGNFDLIFYISMFGEVLMVLYFYLYAQKRESLK